MAQGKIKTRVVGVDIGLERTTTAVVDIRGNILGKDDFPTSDYPNISDFASVLCDNIITLVQAHGGYETIRAVGISVPSGNYRTGCVVNSPNMPWKGVVPMAAMLRDRIGLAVSLGNNAHVRALGEQTYGAAHGLKDFILITLGTGMGSCLVSNGVPHLGQDGFAGEIGHSCAVPGGRQCGCGKKGCLEMYTSKKGIVMTAKELLADSDAPSLMREVDTLTLSYIVDCCEKGDEMAIEVFNRTGKTLGLALANYASVFNPEAFVFTGSVMCAGEWLLKPTEETFQEHVFRNIAGRVKFLSSELEKEEMDLLGASALAWEVEEYSLFK